MCACLNLCLGSCRQCPGSRYASFKAVIASKKKSVEQLSADQLGLACTPQLRIVKVEEPEKRKCGHAVSSVPELLDFLETQKVF